MIAKFSQGLPQKDGVYYEGEELKGLKILVVPTSYLKCERCWQRRPEVGTLEIQELCRRCFEVVKERI